MDIIIATSPDTVALEQEVFATLMDLVKTGADPFSPQFELLIEMSPLPDKIRVLDRLKAFREQVQQAQAQQMQQQAEAAARAQQIGEATAMADIRNKDASTDKIIADTAGKRVETEKSVLDALIPNHLQERNEAA